MGEAGRSLAIKAWRMQNELRFRTALRINEEQKIYSGRPRCWRP